MPLQIALLGPVEIRKEGASVRLGRRERAVVALLALHEGRALPAASVIEQLWGENFPDTATNAIQGYVSRIRRALGHEAIRTVGVGYALDMDACQVDAYRFEQLGDLGRLHLKEGRPEQAAAVLREALSLWRGEPLTDCGELPFGEAYAIRLQERHLVTLEDRIDADIACGDGPRVLDEVTALARTAIPPDQDATLEELMAAAEWNREDPGPFGWWADAGVSAGARSRASRGRGASPGNASQQQHGEPYLTATN